MSTELLTVPPTEILPPSDHEALPQWENLDIDGEHFLAQRGHKNLVEVNGRQITFSVDIYHHPETGMEIEMYSLGMDKPQKQPTIIRADYGCPCMNYPSNFHMQAHDCKQQRDMMFETMATLGTGVMAVISEQTAAGNGHGKHVVHGQATIQSEAQLLGTYIPTQQEAFSQMGYYDDIRRHDIGAKLIKATIGDRPALVTTSNPDKKQPFIDAGITVVPNTRVELVTPQSLTRQMNVGRRDYEFAQEKKTGAYLVNGHTTRLTPKIYDRLFVREHPIRDRIILPVRRFVSRLHN